MTRKRVLVVGWRGGVGTALLSLLRDHPAGREIAAGVETLFLVDRASSGASCPALQARVLTDANCDDPETLARILRDLAIDTVIEVADVDTPAMSAVCAGHGADYVSASIQCPGKPTIVGASELLAARPAMRTSHLLGAGMNPGIVNVLASAAVDELARRSRVAPADLELVGVHVTEQDTTTSLDIEAGDVVAMSWSPGHALGEILEPFAMYVARGRPTTLPHRSHDYLYAVRCGHDEIAAMIVPHEELVSIGTRFPDVESAFFYSVPAAYATLRRAPDRRAREWPTRRLYPPQARRLSGRDRVGALICTKHYGELWAGFDHDAACARNGSYNATTFQAAAGVLAGWTLLGTRRGVHVTDELDHDAYLAIVEAILGPRVIVHAPDAPVRSVASRRCDAACAAAGGLAI